MSNLKFSDDLLAKYLSRGFVVESESETMVVLVKNRKVGVFWNLVLSVVTSGFWLIVWVIRLIFKRSTVRLDKSSGDSGASGPSANADTAGSNFSADLSPELKRGLKIGALVLAAVIIAASVVSGQVQQARKDAESYSASRKLIEVPLSDESCSAIEKVIVDGEIVKFAEGNKKRAKKAADSLDIWNAGNYLAKYPWVQEAISLQNDFETEVASVVNPELASRVAALKNDAAESGFEKLKSDWQEQFNQFAITSCDLGNKYDESFELVESVQFWAHDITQTAQAKPWHPKGFEELPGFPGFAIMAVNGGGCDYSFGSCAKFKITAEQGCPGTLYVEVNLIENNEVVDWGNDTVNGLGVNQVAVMEASFLDGTGRGSWELVDLSCY